MLWLQFIICAAAVVFFGYRICLSAEKIAQITKIGRSFIGLILLAIVTSLPELAVTISAVKIGALNLAVGDIFGSNLFNLTIVAVIFLYSIKQPKLLAFEPTHFISSSFSVLLIALSAMGIIFYNFVSPGAAYSRFLVDVETALILVVYCFGAYLLFHSAKAEVLGLPEDDVVKPGGTFQIWLKFLIYSGLLVGFAIYLSKLGNRIAQIPVGGVALGGTFVGGLFIAVTTSLPEMAVAISALKLGFLDMALGNIFGSNMFNILILSFMDLSLGRKIILSSVSSLHLFTIVFVIISTTLVMSGLTLRSRKKLPALAWDSAGILFVYFAANLVNFYLR